MSIRKLTFMVDEVDIFVDWMSSLKACAEEILSYIVHMRAEKNFVAKNPCDNYLKQEEQVFKYSLLHLLSSLSISYVLFNADRTPHHHPLFSIFIQDSKKRKLPEMNFGISVCTLENILLIIHKRTYLSSKIPIYVAICTLFSQLKAKTLFRSYYFLNQ